MAGAVYSLSTTNVTDTTATIIIEALVSTTAGEQTLTVSHNGTTAYSTTIEDPGMSTGQTISASATGLTASTTYIVDFGGLTSTSFTTKATGYNDPKIATQAQWEDLASKVKASSGTITEVQANGTTVASSGVANIPAATTSAYGVTELSDSVISTSTTLAATANAAYKAFQNGAFYGDCSTAASTAEKAVTCSNFVLTAGAHITVRFTTANTAANATLNVNNTGAHAIYLRGNPAGSGAWAAYDVVDFVYDNSSARWRMVGGPAGILYGTSAPTSAQGADGDIYVQYAA